MERLFRALGDSTRLRLLNLIAGHEVCVCFLVEVLALPQPLVSRHLAYLRRAGLVTARREGKWMHYRAAVLADAGLRRVLAEALAWLASDPRMRAERERLSRACCAPVVLEPLRSAPRPTAIAPTARDEAGAGRRGRRGGSAASVFPTQSSEEGS